MKRIENLQQLLLSSLLIDQFIEMISTLGVAYFTTTELDYLEEIRLIDIGVLALLLTLSSSDAFVPQNKHEWFRDKDNLFQNNQHISNS